MGAVIEHFDLYFTTLDLRSIIIKLPHSPPFFLTGSKYTCSCYDLKYPPPLRAEVLVAGVNLKLRSRTEVNQKMIESAKWVREVIGDYMACSLVTETCTNLTTNHMETQDNSDSDTCVHSSARFPWFRVEFCFALISCCKRKQCPIIFSRLLWIFWS